jgi:hypothetical protein
VPTGTQRAQRKKHRVDHKLSESSTHLDCHEFKR